MGDAALGGVGGCATELLMGDDLTCDGADDIRAGDVHLADAVFHDDEIGDGGAVDRAAGGGAHDEADLWDDAGCEDVSDKHVAVTGEAVHALLDARAAGVHDADDRRAGLHRHVLNLVDLAGGGEGEGAAEDGEIKGVDEDGSAIDCAIARNDGVAGDLAVGEAKLKDVVGGEGVEFDKRVGVI